MIFRQLVTMYNNNCIRGLFVMYSPLVSRIHAPYEQVTLHRNLSTILEIQTLRTWAEYFIILTESISNKVHKSNQTFHVFFRKTRTMPHPCSIHQVTLICTIFGGFKFQKIVQKILPERSKIAHYSETIILGRMYQ
jgi:hypothetical protein